jgi:hypothetical protein
MSDHSIYLRVSGVYVHEKCCLGTPYLCGAWKVPVWPSMVSDLRDTPPQMADLDVGVVDWLLLADGS